MALTFIDITANDYDLDGDSVAAIGYNPRAPFGTIVLGPGPFSSYTPDQDVFGTDTFTYQFDDGQALSNIGTVTIVIAATPYAAKPDIVTTTLGVTATFSPFGNDVNATGAQHHFVLGPLHGVVMHDATTKVNTYQPNPGFVGRDSYKYSFENAGRTSNTATVYIEVKRR